MIFASLMAARAYAATAAYDAMISQWFAFADQQQLFPEMLAITGTRREELRYGENPHQRAALYLPKGPHGSGIAQARQVQGKELSYNNYSLMPMPRLNFAQSFAGKRPPW
jgi:phosphoribosylaminoimidazolecarboxamide formyltransferase/IMP cyclohydrolase